MNARILAAFTAPRSPAPRGRTLAAMNLETELAAGFYRERVAERALNVRLPGSSAGATNALGSTFH